MDNLDKIRICRVFRKRRVSKDTFSYLLRIAPRKASVEEIVEKIGASRTSVLGALRGLSTRYNKEESLEYFGLVTFEKKTINQNTVVVYGLTPIGLKEKGLVGDSQNNTNLKLAEPVIKEG